MEQASQWHPTAISWQCLDQSSHALPARTSDFQVTVVLAILRSGMQLHRLDLESPSDSSTRVGAWDGS